MLRNVPSQMFLVNRNVDRIEAFDLFELKTLALDQDGQPARSGLVLQWTLH